MASLLRDLWRPLLIFLALAALAWVDWRHDTAAGRARVHDVDAVLAEVVASQLDSLLTERARDLGSLAQARLAGTLATASQFEQRADGLIQNHPVFAAIAVLDRAGRVRWARQAAPSTDLRGMDVRALPGRAEMLDRASRTGQTVLSPTFHTAAGTWGVALYVPITRGRAAEGFVMGVLHGARLVSSLIPSGYIDQYQVRVAEQGGDVLHSAGEPVIALESQLLEAFGRTFVVDVWPTRRTLNTLENPAGARIDLAAHLGLAAVVSLLVYLVMRERTRAVEKARALAASERRLGDIIARSPWCVVQLASDGTLEDLNPAAEEVFKHSRADLVGSDPAALIHPDDRARSDGHYRAIVRGEAAGFLENRVLDREGRVHTWRWNGVARCDASGTATGVVYFGQDITAEVSARQAQERLQVEEQRLIERLWILNDFARSLRMTLDAASLYHIAVRAVSNVLPQQRCAILVYHPESRELEVAAVRSSDARAQDLPLFTPGRRIPAADTDLLDAVAECRQHVAEDLAESTSRHEQAAFRAGFRSRSAVPILVDNRCVGMLLAYSTEPRAHTRDNVEFMQGIAEHLALALTNSRLYGELKDAYTEIRSVQEQIVQVEKLRAVGEMASGIAHDFNNSLAAILGYAELLADERLSAEGQACLQNVLKAAHDAAGTVRRIQEFSRRRTDPDTLAVLDPAALARDAVTLTRHKWRDQAQSRGITVTVEVHAEEGLPPIRGNATELREVLTNLVFNAVDAMPRGGRITVRAARRDGRVAISVEDTGTGMSEAVRSRIFDPFFTTKGVEGNGLGLSVSCGIVQRHGGELQVSTVEGEGSVFTVLLPAAGPLAAPPPVPPDDRPLPPLDVLVIDDDAAVADVVATMLRRMGNRVVSAAAGVEGLAQVRQRPFDLVITDLGMPGMNGREVAVAVKDLRPQTRVIMLTGWGDQFRQGEPLPADVDLVLGKPVQLEDLRRALHQVVASRQEVAA